MIQNSGVRTEREEKTPKCTYKVFEAFCGPKYPRVGPDWSPWHVSLIRDASVGDNTCLLTGMETSLEVNFANNARQSILA